MSRTRHHGDKAKQRQFGDLWWWYRSTPSAWNNLMHTKPRRARERNQLAAAKQGEVEQVWPLDKKPHVYYW